MLEPIKELTTSEIDRYQREWAESFKKQYEELDSLAKRIGFAYAINNFVARELYKKVASSAEEMQ